MYDEFKRRLIEEMVLRRDIIVLKQKNRTLEPIFEITSDDDKLYEKLLDEFDRIAIRNVERLIGGLCQKYGFDVELAGNSGEFDLIISKGSKSYCIELKSSPRVLSAIGMRHSPIERLMRAIESTDKPVCVVFLVKDNEESRNEMLRIESRRLQNKYPDNLKFMLFDDLMNEFFGENELNDFKKAMISYKEEMHQAIGYQITEIFNEHNLLALKADMDNELRTFDYDSLRRERYETLRSDNDRFRDISDRNFATIKSSFIDQKRYQLLLRDGDFAKSFLTSEWLYKKYFALPEMDNTFIVAGYLKSIEQLLWQIIYLVGQGRDVRGVIVEEDNKESIDTTLGSLQWFITDYSNDDLFESAFGYSTHSVMQYLRAQLKDWRQKNRNGYFHKHNLGEKEKIEIIRNETIFLYFLILGTLIIDEDTMIELSV